MNTPKKPKVITPPTLEEIQQHTSYVTCYRMISALASHCAADEDQIIDRLTGYLWDAEEAKRVKAGKERFGML
jgi:hypothetical protein